MAITSHKSAEPVRSRTNHKAPPIGQSPWKQQEAPRISPGVLWRGTLYEVVTSKVSNAMQGELMPEQPSVNSKAEQREPCQSLPHGLWAHIYILSKYHASFCMFAIAKLPFTCACFNEALFHLSAPANHHYYLIESPNKPDISTLGGDCFESVTSHPSNVHLQLILPLLRTATFVAVLVMCSCCDKTHDQGSRFWRESPSWQGRHDNRKLNNHISFPQPEAETQTGSGVKL